MRKVKGFNRKRGLKEEGFTLVELMISITIMALVVPAMILLLNKTRQAFSAEEMHMQLKATNEQEVNRVHYFLASDKHIFEGDSTGVSFLGLVTLSAGTPAPLAGSKLPVAMLSPSGNPGSLSPNSTGFNPANIGNSFFFLAYDSPQTLRQPVGSPVTTFAPATITGNNQNGQPQTVIMDLYRFYYYYLTSTNPHASATFPSYSLVEWQSIQYADAQEIFDIGDGTLMGNVSQSLLSLGVTYAVDPTATNTAPASLFYDIKTGGVYPTHDTTLTIAQNNYILISHTPFASPGILSSGFLYGISPNSSLWVFPNGNAPAVVPEFASPVSFFPGGFEVGLTGSTAGRQVMLRSVLVAKGSAPKIEVDDMNTIVEARDE